MNLKLYILGGVVNLNLQILDGVVNIYLYYSRRSTKPKPKLMYYPRRSSKPKPISCPPPGSILAPADSPLAAERLAEYQRDSPVPPR